METRRVRETVLCHEALASTMSLCQILSSHGLGSCISHRCYVVRYHRQGIAIPCQRDAFPNAWNTEYRYEARPRQPNAKRLCNICKRERSLPPNVYGEYSPAAAGSPISKPIASARVLASAPHPTQPGMEEAASKVTSPSENPRLLRTRDDHPHSHSETPRT